MLHALIMAGGSGTRFWPLSRQNRPKHLIRFVDDRSLLQQTYDRIEPLVPGERIRVITAADHADECREQLPKLRRESIVAEPCRRDTAACVGLAAQLALHDDRDATMVVMPADHLVQAGDQFRRAIVAAARLVDLQPARLVTFGIRPNRPATGYGYIHRGEPIGDCEFPTFRVQSFREKPALDLAERYVDSGEYDWNGGIFVWRARTILDEIEASKPALAAGLNQIGQSIGAPQHAAVLADLFPQLERISIDYAVLERARDVVVIEAPFDWDDIGSWQAIDRLHPHRADGNAVRGTHCGLETAGCIIVGEPGHLIATIGVDHLVIVQTPGVTLVADKRSEESVKQLVEHVRSQGLERYL